MQPTQAQPTQAPNEATLVDQLHDTATRGVEAIHAIVLERNNLRVECERHIAEIALLRERAGQLESRLNVASSERDYYMRYSVELVSRLNNLQVLITNAIDEAGKAVYEGPKQQKLSMPSDVAAMVETLLKRLPTTTTTTTTDNDKE